tara:strand:+ start:549 stop:1187 length:639 start_codon:yes stop_codon:yes gene_type:complete
MSFKSNLNATIYLKLLDEISQYPQSDLMVVTKNQSELAVLDLINNGQRIFGENRIQEAKSKFSNISSELYQLHLIGPLQSNKVKMALNIFDVIQSIDRPKIVYEIVKFLPNTPKTKEFYIQINIGKEQQKSGVAPELIQNLYDTCIDNNLNITGFMCIPPLDQPAEFYFKKMVEIKNNINPSLKLSMGMSNDYKLALELGSNLIRIGSLLFK